MRILLFSPGSTVHTERFTKLLLDAGHEIVLADEVDPRLLSHPNYRFIRFRATYLRGERFSPVGKLGKMIRRSQIKSVIDRARADIVHIHWIDFRADLCTQLKVHPLVLTAWGTDINHLFLDSRQPREGSQHMGDALAHADLITADSDEILRRCEVLAGRKLNTCIFHIGVNVDVFGGDLAGASTIKKRLGIPDSWRVILNARRIHPSLGTMHVLKGFAEVAWDIPNLCLVFRQYNGNFEVEQSLRSTIKNLGLESRTFWLKGTSYSEVPLHYALADVVVNYPDEDAFPVSLLEAALARRCIVTSDLPVYREVFNKEVIYVPPGNQKLLGQALRAVLEEDPHEGNGRIEAAARIAAIVGSPRINVENLMRSYATLKKILTN